MPFRQEYPNNFLFLGMEHWLDRLSESEKHEAKIAVIDDILSEIKKLKQVKRKISELKVLV